MLSILTLPNQVLLFLVKTSFDKGMLAKITPNKTILDRDYSTGQYSIHSNQSLS